MTFGLIQGNVDQGREMGCQPRRGDLQEYLRMTRQAIARGCGARLWPESSTPFFFEEDRPAAEQVRALARAGACADPARQRRGRARAVRRGTTTRRFWSAPDGATGGVVSKMHLVPFGEYVPLKRLLFFAGRWSRRSRISRRAIGGPAPGRRHPISTAICYEIVYPDLVRQFVCGGSELLTTITNDAWFGADLGAVSAFRAGVDAGDRERPLSGARGQHRHQRHRRSVRPRPGADRIFEPAVIVGEARFLRRDHLHADRRRVRLRVGCVAARSRSLVGRRGGVYRSATYDRPHGDRRCRPLTI